MISRASGKFTFLQPTFMLTWLSIFAISCLRAGDTILYPTFWAEDGTFFFKDAIEQGAGSIFKPVEGHFHLIPRVLSFLGTVLPTFYLPLFITLTAGLVSAACCAYFVREGFSWIVHDRWARFFGAVLISFLPGSDEVLFAYCTMNYMIFVLIILILLEDYRGAVFRQVLRELCLSLLWFSAGQSIVFLPVLFWDIWRKNLVRRISFVTLLLSVFANWVAVHNLDNPNYNGSTVSAGRATELIRVYFDNLFMREIYRPLLTDSLARSVAALDDLFFYGFSIIMVTLYSCLLFKSGTFARCAHLRNRFLVLTLATAAIFPLTFSVRAYAASQLNRQVLSYSGRYSFQPFLMGFLLLILLIRGIGFRTSFQKVLALIVVGLALNGIFVRDLRFKSGRFSEFERDWPAQAEAIDSAIRKVRVLKESSAIIVPGPIRSRPDFWPERVNQIVIVNLS